MTKKKLLEKYPFNEGWLHAKLDFKPGESLDVKGVKIVVSLGEIDEYEFGYVKVLKTKAKVIFRKKSPESLITNN